MSTEPTAGQEPAAGGAVVPDLAQLADAVAVMDRLRSPGGCPWDREQTHTSLARYAIEEAFEVAEAAEGDDPAALREELGDLLLQVLFHARIASETPREDGGFDLGDIAATLSAKLRRRHPHVFPDAAGQLTDVADAEAVNRQWEAIKQAERAASRPAGVVGGSAGSGPATGSGPSGQEAAPSGQEAAPSVLAGVPEALPALMRAQQVLRRARRAGIAVGPDPNADLDDAEAEVGAELLAVVARAAGLGVDAEAALRRQVRSVVQQVRSAEQGRAGSGGGAGDGDAEPGTDR